MIALLLGAGYATRLYPLTKNKPKPLLPIVGVPIMERIIGRLVEVQGLTNIYIISNHRFINTYTRWANDYRQKCTHSIPIDIIDDLTNSEEDRLGAIGDIKFFLNTMQVHDDVMIIAGDNLIEFQLNEVAEMASQKQSSIVALKHIEDQHLIKQYSVVEIDEHQKIIDFEEKPPLPRSSLISIGVYYFRREHLPLIDKYIMEGHNTDAPGYYIQWLHRQIELYGFVTKGLWFDIGDIDSYNQANELYKI